MRLAQIVACTEKGNECIKDSIGKPEGKAPVGMPRHYIKIGLKER
jgi:hypothetical protein